MAICLSSIVESPFVRKHAHKYATFTFYNNGCNFFNTNLCRLLVEASSSQLPRGRKWQNGLSI